MLPIQFAEFRCQWAIKEFVGGEEELFERLDATDRRRQRRQSILAGVEDLQISHITDFYTQLLCGDKLLTSLASLTFGQLCQIVLQQNQLLLKK
jgi:hypothetical protein